MISIIIPTYNAGATIQACINSIIIQNYPHFEILVIDALSTDSTANIVNAFSDPRIFLFSEADKGIYDAMNKGIRKAKGDYLYFLGSDDTLFDNEILSNVASEIAKTNDCIFYGNVKMIGKSTWIEDGGIYGGVFDLKRLFNFNIPHQAIFYHKTVFDKIGGFNIHYPLLADHDFIIKAAVHYNLKYIDIIVANFSLGGASSKNSDLNFEQDKIKNIINYFRSKIHTSVFVDLRLFIQQAAFKRVEGISLATRVYCIFVYAKLKAQSLLR